MSTAEMSFADALFLACQLDTKSKSGSAFEETMRRVLEELNAAEQSISQLGKVFYNPGISSEKLKNALGALEGQVSRITLEFLYILAQKRRLKLLPGICRKFESLIIHESGLDGKGELHVKLIFAYEPPESLLEKLRVSLPEHGLYPAALSPKVKFEVAVDPGLIAGFIAEANGKILDVSLSRKLAKRL
jgi:ATP synthase F1 delta subunit